MKEQELVMKLSVGHLQYIAEDITARKLTGFTYWFEFRERLIAVLCDKKGFQNERKSQGNQRSN